MKDKKDKFEELAKAKIQPQRNIVISSYKGEKGITIAQQLEVQEGTRTTSVFLKDSIHVESIDGLYNLRDACNVAISKLSEKQSDEEEWDN